MSRLRSLLAGLFRRNRVEHDIDDEMAFHIEARARALEASGVDPEAARRRARLEFGSIEHYKEEVRASRGLGLIDELRGDLASGFRTLRRSPGFAVIAASSLAIGIGANTLVFSLVDATLLRPYSLPDSDRLVTIWNVPDTAQPDRLGTSSIPRYFALRDGATSFESMAAFNGIACGVKTLGLDERGATPERILGQTVSPTMFRTLGVQPTMGRAFTDDEDRADQVAAVVLLSYQAWQARFGADPHIVGKTITLDRTPWTVIGVMPESFDFFGTREFFAPLCLTRAQVEGRTGGNTIVARLKPGVSVEEAQAEIDVLGARLAESDPARHKGIASRVESLLRSHARLLDLSGQPSGDYASPLMILQGAVAFVLLIACANVAGLLLARASKRRTEVAVRMALGAGRRRIMRQLIAESVPLAFVGAVAAIALAWGGLQVFVATAPPDFPRLANVAIDLRVLAFTAVVALVTMLGFAVVPALRSSNVPFSAAVEELSRRSTEGRVRRRLRSALVTGQVALALILLLGAGLMVRSFTRALGNDLGGDATRVLTFDYRFSPREGFRQVGIYRGITGLFEVSPVPAESTERVLDRLQSLPGVQSVAAAHATPFDGTSWMMPFVIEGRPQPSLGLDATGAPVLPQTQYIAVSRGFFSTMGIPVRRGREFDRRDHAAAPYAVIINEAMARQYFPGENPLGQHLRIDAIPGDRPREIVGVVGDVVTGPLQAQHVPAVYVSHLQQTSQFTGPAVYTRIGMIILVKTTTEPMALVPAIKAAVKEVDPRTPVALPRTLETVLSAQIRHLRLYMVLLALFGGVSALLAAIGIYGVIAQTVAERTREIGIRVALGARAPAVLLMVLRQAFVVVGVGVAAGLIASTALGRLLEGSLFEVTATDPIAYAAASALLMVVAALASLIPTRRATAIDPTIALRSE